MAAAVISERETHLMVVLLLGHIFGQYHQLIGELEN